MVKDMANGKSSCDPIESRNRLHRTGTITKLRKLSPQVEQLETALVYPGPDAIPLTQRFHSELTRFTLQITPEMAKEADYDWDHLLHVVRNTLALAFYTAEDPDDARIMREDGFKAICQLFGLDQHETALRVVRLRQEFRHALEHDDSNPEDITSSLVMFSEKDGD